MASKAAGGDQYPPRAPSRYLVEKHFQQTQERNQGSLGDEKLVPSDGASATASMARFASSSTTDMQARARSRELSNESMPDKQAAMQRSPPSTQSGTRGVHVDAHDVDQVNRVTYKDVTIKALIDPTLRVNDVIRQLCANAHLGVQEPSALFALRVEENDELIDDSNLARKIEIGCNLKLTSSPVIEAVEVVEKLSSSSDDRVLKMATYTLQRFIREKPFADEFLKRGGLDRLIDIIQSLESGNTLAYALTSVQNLIESRDSGWNSLSSAFIRRIIKIVTTQERINVCRPATAILRKLVTSDPRNAHKTDASDIATDAEDAKDDAVQESTSSYGFEVVYGEVQKEGRFWEILTHRLDSADTTLCMYSLSLINSFLRHAPDASLDAFNTELEAVGVSKAIIRLMDSARGEDLSSSILEYQMNIVKVARNKMRLAVTSADKRHVSALSHLWLQARISETSQHEEGQTIKYKWRRLGFLGENVAKDFIRTGWLGLECCESFVRADPDSYAKIIAEQLHRTESRRCPWGQASLEVVEILSDHYDIASGYSTATNFQPFLLSFQRLHYLALSFFLRMWMESGASTKDFARVSALVRSQVREALREEATRSSLDVESDFLSSDYQAVRQRQMRELETEDDFANKVSVRNLRTRLYRESYDFVRQQRIQCLLEGAWFKNAASNSTFSAVGNSMRYARGAVAIGPNGVAAPAKPWRFYRLSPNRKFLYFCESYDKVPIRSGLDDLPERIDLNLVTDISIHSATVHNTGAINGALNDNTSVPYANDPLPLTFSLMRTPDVSLADFVALNSSQFSEWTDGLSMLRNDNGIVSTKNTADFIQILTDIGVKVKLLDLTGEQVDLPTSVAPAPLPSTTSFFFAEL